MEGRREEYEERRGWLLVQKREKGERRVERDPKRENVEINCQLQSRVSTYNNSLLLSNATPSGLAALLLSLLPSTLLSLSLVATCHPTTQPTMGLLENAISEELSPHHSIPPAPPALPQRKVNPRVQEKNKVIAAAVGATLTSLTSTSSQHIRSLSTSLFPTYFRQHVLGWNNSREGRAFCALLNEIERQAVRSSRSMLARVVRTGFDGGERVKRGQEDFLARSETTACRMECGKEHDVARRLPLGIAAPLSTKSSKVLSGQVTQD